MDAKGILWTNLNELTYCIMMLDNLGVVEIQNIDSKKQFLKLKNVILLSMNCQPKLSNKIVQVNGLNYNKK